MALQHRRHQLSLTGFIPKPKPPSLTPEEYGSVQALFKTLIEYASNRKAKGRYKPAALISQTFQHVKSTDEFLIHFFVYTYARIHPEVEDEAGPEFHQAYTYFGDFSLWNSTRKDEAAAAMDKFAQYMIDNFFMPPHSCIAVFKTVHTDRYTKSSIKVTTSMPSPRPPPLCSIANV
ncbi:hypothetical protein EYZ11_013578 [Aspergillus tanneri]|uniref:Uncharacterized protein n=1 Tax=Aspergillus tanneri TaxID=1220188 RepID=A0A4S3IXB9_9EURO|nr:hypothetical protein EYZ11_013578 [Aspergillus tanneri]